MIADFRRIFNPTIKEQLEDLETALEVHNLAIRATRCSTCKYWTPPPKDLPGFVENHGDCAFNHTVDLTPKCLDYEIDDARETEEYNKIKNEIDKLEQFLKDKENHHEKDSDTI